MSDIQIANTSSGDSAFIFDKINTLEKGFQMVVNENQDFKRQVNRIQDDFLIFGIICMRLKVIYINSNNIPAEKISSNVEFRIQ